MQLSCKSQVNNRPVPLTLSDYIDFFFFFLGGGGGLTSWRYRQRHTAYLNGIMNVLCHVLQSRLRRAVVRGIVEFTHAFSLLHWSYIDWHTVWLHEALHTTASLIGTFTDLITWPCSAFPFIGSLKIIMRLYFEDTTAKQTNEQ